MCLTFSTYLCETFLILRTIQRLIIINVYRSSCKVPVIFVRESINADYSSNSVFPVYPTVLHDSTHKMLFRLNLSFLCFSAHDRFFHLQLLSLQNSLVFRETDFVLLGETLDFTMEAEFLVIIQSFIPYLLLFDSQMFIIFY